MWQEKINTNGNIIIFKFNELDKRSKFYKQFENGIVEFNKLSDEILIQYIQRELPLSNQNCKKLIDICNSNYNQILLEINKIKQFQNYYNYTEYDIDKIFIDLEKQRSIS